jgi:putative CocE/NonD family hydrolase
MKRLIWTLLLAVSANAALQDPFTAPVRKPEFQDIQASSLYVPMRDNVRIAIDVLLPKGLRPDQKVPALFKISRFGRAAVDGSISDEDRFWVQHGFARVLIDERGTGASFGTSHYGSESIPDLYDIVDWVVKQQWSNGRVGAIGVSFEGTASELLAATGHPAVRAVAPWFSDYNYYTDLVRPGGVFNEWILKNVEDFTLQMDSGESAKHVEGDSEGKLMKQAIAEHRGNLNIHSATKNAPFIDDPLAATGKTLLGISIPGAAGELHKAHIPMLILVSWYDAGTVQGTIQRFREFSNSQSIFVGAWSHGAGFNADPFLPPGPAQPGWYATFRRASCTANLTTHNRHYTPMLAGMHNRCRRPRRRKPISRCSLLPCSSKRVPAYSFCWPVGMRLALPPRATTKRPSSLLHNWSCR